MAERLSVFNDPPQILPGPQLLHELIHFERHNDACAIDFTRNDKRRQYTYQELQSCVTALKQQLEKTLATSERGKDQNSTQHIVPVLLPQSPGLYTSQLAILQLGGAFCPINLDAPRERIKFVVGDVSASLIITTSEFRDVVSWEDGPTVIIVDEFPDVPRGMAYTKRSREPRSQDLAYVMYTSGSSGTPKGVAVSHLAASQSLLAHEKLLPSFKRFLQFAAPSFDVSVFEIFFPLTRGCTLVGCDRSQLLNDLPGMIIDLDVDAAELTPTVVGSLLQKRSNAPKLKLLLTIGEMLTRPIVEEFGGSETKDSILYGMYGPTEAAIHCTIHPRMEASAQPGNIGVAFDTVSAFIAAPSSTTDKDGSIKFLPLGELGELVLGGPQLAQGYLNREEQNKAAFIHTQGKDYYRTGDKARLLQDGTIEILGRISAGQVKLRGQRIELGEIEEAVYKHPGINTVAAVVLNGALVVFALTDDQKLQPEHISATCAKWLPKFMVPGDIVLLQQFSYLPSGKVDKRKLEADYQSQLGNDDSQRTVSTPTERIVEQTLKDVLGSFSRRTSLAAAGLDSLVAIQVASKLRSAGLDISTVAILKAETFAELTKLCEKKKSTEVKTGAEETISTLHSIAAGLIGNAEDVEFTMPCTPLQSALLSETAAHANAYMNLVELELPGISNPEAVISALMSLAELNPVLRTGFAESREIDGFVQIVWKALPTSQIEVVENFKYDFDTLEDSRLHHPLRFQIQRGLSYSKLLIYIHHALYDAWSLELLLDDLNFLLKDQSPPPRPSFASVVEGYLDGSLTFDSRISKDYWKDHLSDLELRQLPNFHSTKAPPTGLAAAKLETKILTSDADTVAKSLSSSPQAIFQAAYTLVLSSYLGSSDVCFGTVSSGRTLPIAEIENIIGPCLSTLPMRIDVSTSKTFRDLVQDLNSINRKHLEHSAVPLRSIKSAAGVNPRQQIFDTLLIWQQTLHSYDHSREHVVLIESVDNLEFNLTLEIVPSAANIELRANYQQSLFPTSQIRILLMQVEQIASAIIKDATLSVKEAFSQLSNDVLSVENEHPEIALKSGTLSSPVEQVAHEDPDRLAIEFATTINSASIHSQRVTYSELNSRANQMGRYLLSQSLLPDELVCICIEKCVDLYVSILASAKVGAGYLPVTPDVPSERLQHILREAKVNIVLAHSSSQPLLKRFGDIKVIYVDQTELGSMSSKDITPRSSSENISYCVFTSGSTGTPKGVLVTQGNLLSNLDVLEDLYPAKKEARLLQSCSQAFDVSVFEIFFTWRIGGCLCSAVKDILFQDIENAIRNLQITHLSLTPTVASLIEPRNVPTVQFLVTAGEAVTQKVFNAWANNGLYQGYGPSETTNICTVKPKVSLNDSINNIGPPFKNTSAFVLSSGPDFALVPRGGEGEFCFGGAQVFRGYMDFRQNVGKIIEHPVFGRVYRSGDFGRLMPDGSLAFTGRKDDQVKVRGQRVELGEINSIMLRSEEVRDCVTMAINGVDGSQRLVCFWTSGAEPPNDLECLDPNRTTLANLYRNLSLALPSYMVPSALIPISHLPSTSQGKIDKRLLIQVFEDLAVDYLNSTAQISKYSSEHTWTDLEQRIGNALAQYTKVPLQDINAETSFFSLGIDSISSIALSRIMRETIRCQIDVSDILKYPSIAKLGERISSRGGVVDEKSPTKAQAFDFDEAFLDSTAKNFKKAGKIVERILPCTPLQEAMLSAAQSSKNLYNNEVVLNVNGNVEKLQACWQEMARRHEILRTCFVPTDMPQYAYVQVVLEKFEPEFTIVDEPKIAAKETEDVLAKEIFVPLYKFDLVRAEKSRKLVISMHHALYDGIAVSLLYDEVEKLYQGQVLPPAISFTPFLEYMLSMKTNESDQFWKSTLKDCIPTRMKPTIPQSSGTPKSSIIRKNAISTLRWIGERYKKHNTSLLSVCQAVWVALISERFEVTDVCFGNVVSGRTVPVDGIERLVAPCFNTIPARIHDVQKLTYLETFRKLQEFNAKSLQFQLTPLRRIQSKFSPDGLRLFDTLFILQQPTTDRDASIWSIVEDNGAMDFPLVCEVTPDQNTDTLEIILHFHSSFIIPQDATSIIDSFINKLQVALDNPRHQILSSDIKECITAKTLEADANAHTSKVSDFSKPMTANEVLIRDILLYFTDVPVEQITRDVSIFRLGLDSISAVQVAARLRKRGYSVMASDILEHPTVGQLAAHLAQNNDTLQREDAVYNFTAFDTEHREAICSKLNISPEDVENIRPCTAVQQGMIAQTLHSEGEQYFNSMWFELLPQESISRLKASWESICEKHEILRSGFVPTDDPKNPFALVTYTKEIFPLPWYETRTNQQSHSAAEKLARHPWSLTVDKIADKSLLKFTAHHALYDAQSIQIILSDVGKAYVSEPLGSESNINLLLGSILQHERKDIEHKTHFWQRHENKIAINRFPDLTPLRVSGFINETCEISSQARISDLEELCKRKAVTMQAAGQAAWARLLAAYTGESTTTFGMTLSGRAVHEDADSIAFPAIVTLPVRCDVTGSNEELLSRTMSSNASLHKYQFTPLTSIQRWAGFPEGNVFDTLFAYQKLPAAEEVSTRPWKVVREEATVDYAVSLEVQPTVAGELTLRLTFRENVIPVEHADLLLRQYDALLLDLLQNSERPCDVMTELGNDLLSITPAKDPVLSGSVNLLHEFLEQGARDFPEKTALEFATRLELENFQSHLWTYNEVNGESNKVANLLCGRGISPGELIAICFDKCPEASFAIVGILKSGCAYVALDPNAPPERLKFIIEDSRATLVLTSGKPAQNFLSLGKEVVNLDSQNVLAECSPDPPSLSRKISPQDTSYCLYTSGTTGTPKGCLISHENAVQAMYSFQRLFSMHWTESSKWLQFASFHFDVSVLEQFWSWSVGICVVSAPRDLIFEDIPVAIQRLGITHIDLTPSLARLVHPDDVPSLCNGVFITGGEQLRQDILDVWGEHGCIYNGYGPTEATIGCTMFPRVPKNGKPTNIGPQFDNVGSYVLKPGSSTPVLRGGVGELCVSGKLVGKGYLNRAELTAERFPVLETFNERLYRTGDLVRILHDGSFIFLGRADDQVKLRGQRLELSEINQVIMKNVDLLEEVVTLVLRHKTQQKEQLVTFFVSSSHEGNQVSSLIASIKDTCKARLPNYMVPTHIISINALPLNANNKADSKQLTAIYDSFSIDDLQRISHSAQQNKEWTSVEENTIQILAKVLDMKVSVLTRDITIFELGLDSISIIGFSHALQTAGLANAKVSVIKSNPAIGNLIGVLLEEDNVDRDFENAKLAASQQIAAFSQSHKVNVCQSLGAESVDIEIIAPCTPVQEGMIYRFLESQHALYFHVFEFLLEETIDTTELVLAWKTVVKRLEILRTKFVTTDDGYAQVVVKSLDLAANYSIDYNTADKSVALRNPHKLTIIATPRGNVLSLQIFHGLYDGNSLTMMLQCLIKEYHGVKNIDYGPSYHSSLQYGPLVKLPGAVEFWKSHLNDWSYQQIPSNSIPAKDVVVTRLLQDIDGIERLRKKLGVTHQAMIQATWLSVLQLLLSPVLTIGMITSGRLVDFERADKVIGPLFNTLPFHVKIDNGMTASSFISRCHDFNMKIQDFQHTPLKDIQKCSPAKPGQTLFDTLFVFLHPELDDEDYSTGVWTRLDEEQTADYALAFEASLNADSSQLRLTIIAQGSSIAQSQAAELLDQFEESLRTILKEAGRNVLSQDIANLNGVNGKKHPPTKSPSYTASGNGPSGGHQRGSFEWTKQATQIRYEITSLAGVDESQVRETSSIFELGLDSIDVIKLSSRLSRRGIAIPVSGIIKAQTIANMSAKISENSANHQKLSNPKIVEKLGQDLTAYLKTNQKLPDDAEAVLPATPLQQSMINEMIRSNYTRYFTVEVFEIDKTVDLSRLMLAVEQVIRMSPILRTTFTEIDDARSPVSYAQIIHSAVVDSTRISKVVSLDAYLRQFKRESTGPAASEKSLCRIKIVTVREISYLVMAISHALYDGRSLRAIHEDIQHAYLGNLSSRPDSLPYLDLVFQSITEDAKRFWRSALSNLPPAQFPMNQHSARRPNEVHRLDIMSHVSLKDVEVFCRSSRITMQTLGQTCWAIVLSQLMGQLDVVFGSVLSCRDTEAADEVMFPLMNTVAVRSVLHGSVVEMLKYMQEMSDTTRQYQHFSLGTAQAYALASREEVATKNTTLFDTLFIYQGHRQRPESDPLYTSVYGSSDVEFPVCIEMEIHDGLISWTTACKSIARTVSETKSILKALDHVLQYMIANPQAPIIVSDSEGISVCALAKFRKPEQSQKISINHFSSATDEKNWSELEFKIRDVLHQVSDVPLAAIRKDSTIFHLGLDSILVLKLPALLRKHGIKLSVSNILRDQTIYALAQSVLRADPERQEYLDVEQTLLNAMESFDVSSMLKTLEEKVGQVQYAMPATSGQRYMVRTWEASGGTLLYPTFEYTFSGPVKKAQLNTAWNNLLRSNDILRTGFVNLGHDLIQVVFKSPLNEVVYETVEASKVKNFCLDLRFPPVRLVIEQSEHSGATLKLAIHHALYDGISLPLILDQLQSLYQEQTVTPPEFSFKSFVAASIVASKSPQTPSSTHNKSLSRSNWESYFKHESLYQPHSANSTSTASSHRRTEVFSPGMSFSSLKTVAQDAGVSIDALLLASISKVYARSINQGEQTRVSQVVFGIYLVNRAPFGADLSELAAPTLNLLPLCVQDPLNQSISDIAHNIQLDIQKIGSAEMSCVSLADIYEWCGVRVNFFVNILKDIISDTTGVDSRSEDGYGYEQILKLKPKRDLLKKAEVINVECNTELATDSKHDAYLPSIDVEIRYQGSRLDMGVFGPTAMISVAEAQEMIGSFIELLT